jgi:hypothetical protein
MSSIDIDGQFRPQGVRPDIGVDEYLVAKAPDRLKLSCPTGADGMSTVGVEIGPVDATQPVTFATAYKTCMIVETTASWPSTNVLIFWRQLGKQTFVITATNAYGSASAECAINVNSAASFVRLPILGKQ